MAKKGYSRIQRIGDLIQTALAEILQREAEDRNFGMVTVTSVSVAQDLSHAKVFVSILEDTKVKETIKTLNESAKYIRYELAHAVKLRVTPELRFVYDDSIVRGNRISSLINDALKDTDTENDE
ncbi:MAG: 30S ribosome-binding factor RbfA [Gammaproteobacteria bacterium]